MCGSAAAQCAMAPILVGMGFRSLSMSPTSIPFVKATIRSFSVTEAQALASQVLDMETSVEIEDTARSFIADRADPDFST
jgi:phosphoenolpyruvate-protein kinase (PTS system EI component)